MQPSRPEWLVAWLLCMSACSVALGADSLIASTGATRYSDGGPSYSGSVSLLHAATQWGIAAGASDTLYAIGKLGEFDVDAYSLAWTKLTVSGGLSVGSATTGTAADTLLKTRIALESRVNPNWTLRCSDQYIALAQIRGNLLAGGAEYLPEPRIGIRLSGGYSISGTLADRYGDLAFNWYGKTHLFLGLVAGRTGYDPSRLGQDTVIRHVAQVYAGASIPFRHATLTLSTDDTNLAGQPRQSLRIGFILPVS